MRGCAMYSTSISNYGTNSGGTGIADSVDRYVSNNSIEQEKVPDRHTSTSSVVLRILRVDRNSKIVVLTIGFVQF